MDTKTEAERPPIGIAEHLVPAVRVEQHLAGEGELTVCGVPGARITADLAAASCDECVIGRAEQLGALIMADDGPDGAGGYYWMRTGVGTGESNGTFVTTAEAARDFLGEHAALLLEMRERRLVDLAQRLGGSKYVFALRLNGKRWPREVTFSVELPQLEALGFELVAQEPRESTIDAACDYLEGLAGRLLDLVKVSRS